MNIDGWQYYNHAAIPTTAPHEEPELGPVTEGTIWNIGEGKNTPLLVRWTSDWDCGHETQWWYVIKDTPFDISELKSKRRYEINKGKKNFNVKKIIASEYCNELFKVTEEAFSAWPEKYRPTIEIDAFKELALSWNEYDVFGAFEIDSNRLCGYAVVEDNVSYAAFSILRVEPASERKAINAAIVSCIVEYYQERFGNGFYINDGSRAIRHETAFQDYLQKYFNFRKAYCHLNIKYRKGFGLLVKLIYPFRKIIKGKTGLGSQVSGILKMEELSR